MDTREEHLEWCKQRAIKYIERGKTVNAFVSFLSDMSKNPETEHHPLLKTNGILFSNGVCDSPEKMQAFIDEFA